MHIVFLVTQSMNPKSIKTTSAFATLFFLIALSASCQQTYDREGLIDITNYWEINVTTGANNFLGDIGGNKGIGGPFLKDYTFPTNKLLTGVSGSYNLNQWVAIQGGLNFAKVTAADSLINNQGDLERWRVYRNLSFRSNIFEGYINAVFYPTMYFDRRKIELHKIVPFLSCGIGAFHFNPQAQLNGTWINLQPLHLEGQGFKEYPNREPYKLTQIYLPASIGIKYYFNNRWAISSGLLFRKTFTDYIDDISTTYIDPQLFYNYFPL